MNKIKMFSTIIFALVSISSQAQTNPEIFTNVPRPHVDPVIPHSTKVVVTEQKLKVVVSDHNLIGKQLVQDCFDSTVGHVCLDEIGSYFGKEAEDYLQFRIVKPDQKDPLNQYPNLVTIYLDKENKIKNMKSS